MSNVLGYYLFVDRNPQSNPMNVFPGTGPLTTDVANVLKVKFSQFSHSAQPPARSDPAFFLNCCLTESEARSYFVNCPLHTFSEEHNGKRQNRRCTKSMQLNQPSERIVILRLKWWILQGQAENCSDSKTLLEPVRQQEPCLFIILLSFSARIQDDQISQWKSREFSQATCASGSLAETRNCFTLHCTASFQSHDVLCMILANPEFLLWSYPC